jgi:hypothetical protein
MPSCRFDANHHGKHSNQSNKDVALHKRIHLKTPPLLKYMTQNSEFKPPMSPVVRHSRGHVTLPEAKSLMPLTLCFFHTLLRTKCPSWQFSVGLGFGKQLTGQVDAFQGKHEVLIQLHGCHMGILGLHMAASSTEKHANGFMRLPNHPRPGDVPNKV